MATNCAESRRRPPGLRPGPGVFRQPPGGIPSASASARACQAMLRGWRADAAAGNGYKNTCKCHGIAALIAIRSGLQVPFLLAVWIYGAHSRIMKGDSAFPLMWVPGRWPGRCVRRRWGCSRRAVGGSRARTCSRRGRRAWPAAATERRAGDACGSRFTGGSRPRTPA